MSCSRRHILLLALLAFPAMPAGVVADQQPRRTDLIGSWTFVSATDTAKDGSKIDRWGPGARGLAIFLPDGRYSFMISRADLPMIAGNDVNLATGEESQAVLRGISANVGTWSLDESIGTLTTAIEAGSFPNRVGKTQTRVISRLTASELRYTNPGSTAGTVSEAIWIRVK